MEDTYNLHVLEDEEQYPAPWELKYEQQVQYAQEDLLSLEQKQLVQEEQSVAPQANPHSIRTQTIGCSFD